MKPQDERPQPVALRPADDPEDRDDMQALNRHYGKRPGRVSYKAGTKRVRGVRWVDGEE